MEKGIELNKKFIERYSEITNIDEFIRFSLVHPRKSIRVNTLKAKISEIKKRLSIRWTLTPIRWCKEGFFIEHKQKERRDIGNLLEHNLGYIYVQEASSMIPAIVLDPKPGERVLDMCAAPGSKTTQIAQYMKNKGVIVANEISYARMQPLSINIQRCGATNVVKTLMNATKINGLEFDKILLDAPCSGLGTIRKSYKVLQDWSIKNIYRYNAMQKKLVDSAYRNLARGGSLIYSTCTIEPMENEAIITYALNKYDDLKIEKIILDVKSSSPVLCFDKNTFNENVKYCLRIYPQDNNTDGFFVAKLVKK